MLKNDARKFLKIDRFLNEQACRRLAIGLIAEVDDSSHWRLAPNEARHGDAATIRKTPVNDYDFEVAAMREKSLARLRGRRRTDHTPTFATEVLGDGEPRRPRFTDNENSTSAKRSTFWQGRSRKWLILKHRAHGPEELGGAHRLLENRCVVVNATEAAKPIGRVGRNVENARARLELSDL